MVSTYRACVLFGVLFCSALCVSASLVEDVLKALMSAVDCPSCHALLETLKLLAYLGDSTFVSTMITICKTLRLQDADVCQGLLSEQAPIIAHDLRSISFTGQTATKLCDVLLGLCQPPAVNKFTVTFPKAPPAHPKKFQSTGKAPFQVAHFSDVHIDHSYAPGADSQCSKPICCRNYADKTGPIAQPAGPFGSFHCDTPPKLAESMLRAIPVTSQFSIFTGDVVEAAVWLVEQREVTSNLRSFNHQMQSILRSPVYPVIGNEATPINAFPRNTTTSAPSMQWIFDIQSQGWAPWIKSAGAYQVAHQSGSYAVIAKGTNLRIISLNDIYWYKDNFWLYDSDNFYSDPNGVITFAIDQLQAAEDAGQRAWIIAHMPPGGTDTLRDQSNYFDQVIQRYHNTIAAQFYGHTHFASHCDQFAIAYSDYTNRTAENAVSVGLIAPSLTPRSGQPAFKLYDVDPDTYEIMDAKVYLSNVSDPSFQQNPTWQLYYSARDTYGPLVGVSSTESLSPAFWHKVTEAFEANDAAFMTYQAFTTRGVSVTSCDSNCKANTICGLRALRAEDNCVNVHSYE
ncbi:Metallo-dependent phosphatase-like protein [Amanita muscaria]